MSATSDEAADELREPSPHAAEGTEPGTDALATLREAQWKKIEAGAASRREKLLKQLAAQYLIRDGATDTESKIFRETRVLSQRLANLSRQIPTFPNVRYLADARPGRPPMLGRPDSGWATRLAGPQHTWAAYADDPVPSWTPFPPSPEIETFYLPYPNANWGSKIARKIRSADADGTISLAALCGYWPQDSLIYPYDSVLDPWQFTEVSAGYAVTSGDLNALIKQPTQARAFCSIDMPISSDWATPPWWGKLLFGSDEVEYTRFGGFLYVTGNCVMYLSVGGHDLGAVGFNHFLSVGEQGSTVFPPVPPYTDQVYVPQVEMVSSVTIDPAWLNASYPTYAMLSVVVEIACVRINYIPDPLEMNIVGFDFRPSGANDKTPGIFPFGQGTTWSGVADEPAPIKVNALGLTVRA